MGGPYIPRAGTATAVVFATLDAFASLTHDELHERVVAAGFKTKRSSINALAGRWRRARGFPSKPAGGQAGVPRTQSESASAVRSLRVADTDPVAWLSDFRAFAITVIAATGGEGEVRLDTSRPLVLCLGRPLKVPESVQARWSEVVVGSEGDVVCTLSQQPPAPLPSWLSEAS